MPGCVEFKKAFGLKIRARRRQLGMTDRMVAELAGITRQHVNYIETGRKGIWFEKAVSLAMALRWTLQELVAGLDVFFPPPIKMEWHAARRAGRRRERIRLAKKALREREAKTRQLPSRSELKRKKNTSS